MKAYFDVAQYSGDWYRLRLGKPTASCFEQIVTPAKGQLSASSVRYAYQLVAERLLNTPTDSVEGIEHMERGKEFEPEAVKQFEFVEEVETLPVGFITTDDGMIGASPDRLIKGQPRALEIKCPSPHVHLGYLLDGPGAAYRPQVQGQLWVGEFETVDLYAYHPRMPAARVTTRRDEPYIKLLSSALTEFIDRLADMERRARQLGHFQAMSEAGTPLDEQERVRGELDRAFDPNVALREA